MATSTVRAIGAACMLVAAALIWQHARDEGDDYVAFVQTFHRIRPRTPDDARGEPGAPEPCPVTYMPLSQHLTKGTLELFGYDRAVERQAACLPLGSGGGGRQSWELFGTSGAGSGARSHAWLVPAVFGVVCVAILTRMLVNILFLQPKRMASARAASIGTHGPVRRPELESWNTGLITWLSVDWVNEWIARWGNSESSDLTRIRAADLDALGDADDETEHCYGLLREYWAQEVAKRGLRNASIISVMIRFVGQRRLAALAAWTGGYEVAMYLGPPLVMDWTIRYFEYLYTKRLLGEEVAQHELALPSALVIGFFSGVPLVMLLCNTMSTMLSQRLTVRVCGALSGLCFEKAQRLPLSNLAEQQGGGGEAREPRGGAPEKLAGKPAGGKDEPDGDADLGVDESKEGYWTPKSFNLVQMVSNDVNMNIVNIPLNASKVILQIPALGVLLFMLCTRIKWTLCLTIAAVIIVMILVLRNAFQMGMKQLHYFNKAGQRLQFFQGVLFNIRTIKACGWEGIVADNIQEKRVAELEDLESAYWSQGYFFHWIFFLPKALAASSIFGHCWLYPHESVQIFTLLPILLTVQAAATALASTLPVLINARPSIVRVEAFLKLPEAPLGKPKKESTPPWLTLWPAQERGRKARAGAVRVQGDFAWEDGGAPVLRDLDIVLEAGQSLAVLGQVGSGKTTLLHALLGEMYPSGDTRLEVPEKIAYSSQIPYVCEGSLRENVLFGEMVDDNVYETAIFSAGLLPDIEMLPGGQDVPIGSRGISLSGGQKARVSMARAACSRDAPLVLIDDPFGALDPRTAHHVLTNFVHGQGLRGRTRIVVTQPDAERIHQFDKVVVIASGKVVAQGTPDEVMGTPEYCQLLSSHQLSSANDNGDAPHMPAPQTRTTPCLDRPDMARAGNRNKLREEEFEGRVDVESIHYFTKIGSYPYIAISIVMYLAMNICFLLMNVVLQDWSTEQVAYNAGVLSGAPRPTSMYLAGYSAWWAFGILAWVSVWIAGVNFTLRLSRGCHMAIIKCILNAPVDRFFDKAPVGRIMNRMATDLAGLDLQVFNRITQAIGMIWTLGVPLAYVHVLLPISFTLAALPYYFLMMCLIRRYWLTMVPMRYLSHVCKSLVDDALTDVEYSNPMVRGLQKGGYKMAEFLGLMGDVLKVDVNTRLIVLRWLLNRLLFMVGFYTTCVALLALWIPGLIDFGGIGLCLTNMFTIISTMENFMDTATQAQFQFISINRLHEYTKLEQERPSRLPQDFRYASITATIRRSALRGATVGRNSAGGVVVCRCETPPDQSLLVQTPAGDALMAGPDETLCSLDTACAELKDTDALWHRIAAVNGVRGNAEKLAHEIVAGGGDEVRLEIQSGWLAGGAEVVIEDLRAGYGDMPNDILKGLNIVVPPRAKAGIVGSTGCGKSTLMLTLLRILEPRGGSMYINKVNTQDLGLEVLRTSVGLVPQDPVIMEGSVRANLDPFWHFSDSELWRGLGMVQLRQTIEELADGLDTSLSAEGGSLSFGQRQLLCLARVVVRQPALILLDEATSALDPHTQEVVSTTIQESFPESTMVVIAHRLETILDFDLVVVMHAGEVVEQGPAKTLRDVPGGLFAKMLAAKRTW